MRIETTRFGLVDVDEQSVIELVRGILGFEEATRYCLFRHRPDAALFWLQSTDLPHLAFLVIDPLEHYSNYQFELGDSEAAAVGLTDASDAAVLAIVTVREGGASATANLAAPIVFNSKTRVGAQVVLQDGRYCIAEPLRLTNDGAGEKPEHQDTQEAAIKSAA